jgi:hypothetical protein
LKLESLEVRRIGCWKAGRLEGWEGLKNRRLESEEGRKDRRLESEKAGML